ncbi:MAG: hypothetical protein ACREB8_00710 [Pseudolabrys sp.]
MYDRLKKIAKRYEFSRRTLGLGALFIVTAVVALFVDVDALMHYFRIIGRTSPITLETGAIISLASAIPFLATGMSISADEYLRRR